MENIYEDKSNNEILLEIKQMEIDYENLKSNLLKGWDRLIEIEKNFALANKTISDRLKR